jgi:hypothetical protein
MTALSPAVFAAGALSSILPPTKAVISMVVTAPTFVATSDAPVATNDDVTSAGWADIKDFTFDTRAQFFVGLKRLEAKVEGQVGELTAKRAAMPSSSDTRDWDFAMKEMDNAQSYLHSTGAELTKASPETWSQLKDKVGQAWERTQNAYRKVKASTTR